MILHKYINAAYGIDFLIKEEIKVSVPSEFNDPFEALPRGNYNWNITKIKRAFKDKDYNNRVYKTMIEHGVVSTRKEFKALLLKLRENNFEGLHETLHKKNVFPVVLKMKSDLGSIYRVICFSSEQSKEEDQILMWSHYAKSHSGMRIHFDSNLINAEIYPINYVPSRYVIDLTLSRKSIQFQRQYKEMMLCKSMAWLYEQEYRIFIDPQSCNLKQKVDHDIFFVKFPLKSITRIDLGLEFSEEDLKTLALVRQKPILEKVLFFRAVLDGEKFKLNYIQI